MRSPTARVAVGTGAWITERSGVCSSARSARYRLPMPASQWTRRPALTGVDPLYIHVGAVSARVIVHTVIVEIPHVGQGTAIRVVRAGSIELNDERGSS